MIATMHIVGAELVPHASLAWQRVCDVAPAATVAQVAIYTDHWKQIAIIRRIMLRMRSWLNYAL